MAQSKLMMVTDTMTEFVVMVTIASMYDDPKEEVLFRRAGYSTSPQSNTVILTDLHTPRSEYSAFAWESWTMRATHLMLQEMGRDAIMRHDGPLDVREYREELVPKD